MVAKQMAPEDLIHFWLGIVQLDQRDACPHSKLSEDVLLRQEVSTRVGLGFL